MMKRIFALILCFIMMVNLIPMSTFAVSDNDISEEAAEETEKTPCLTCEQYDCTSDHTNWCYDCKKDDCGTTHVWCETCQKNDCGVVSHGKELPRIPEESVSPAAYVSEEVTTEFQIEDLVKFNKETVYVWSDPSNYITQTPVTASGFPAEMRIVEKYAFSTTLTLYKLEAADGSEWPADFLEYVWAEGKYLTKVEEISCDCGCENCIGEEGCVCRCGKCDFCEKEPENTCECCENCTGAEGCECFCGECDFCEKEEEPTVPSISDTVTDVNGNEQTVTVSGEALPEGAKLKVTPVENEAVVLEEAAIENGFIWDIKVFDENGNEWQPSNGKSVRVTLSVSNMEEGAYVLLYHLLETPEAVSAAIANGVALDSSVGEFGSSFESAAAPAVAAFRQVTGSTDDSFVVEKLTPQVMNGTISFETGSFSVWLNGGAWQRYSSANDSNRMVLYSKNSDSVAGQTFYAPIGQTILFNTGAVTTGDHKWRTKINGEVRDTAHYDWGWKNDNVLFTSRSSTDATLVLNDTYVNVGNKVEVYFDGSTVNTSMVITIIVVNEVKVTLNENRANYGKGSDTLNGSTPNASDSKERYHIWYENTVVSYAQYPKLGNDSGYKHVGWNTKADGKGTTYEVNTNYTPTSSTTLYAKWEPIKYTVKFDPNTANAGGGTVTGSMANIGMTYDVETTLPRCKYVNSGDGMVFLGWATSPTGAVEHKDGAKIKNLTTTDGATVTLYAKWKYGLDSKVYIGINNTYHNPNGTYTAGGVTIKSYHTYPNEPAQMTGDFDRVTDDKEGWRYDSASAVPLENKAKDYINGNIFNSPDYEMTYVSGENTLGIADPTGSAVRSMLKFTEADYNAMIAVWLEGMRTTLVGYGDTTFDWQNAKAEDFVMVPYVIKFQNYDSWYIDMVVVPKALYTLAYDGNIENGYTASFSGVAFPPSSQYTDGSMVNVVNTPIGYQGNNMKVTKVVDGHTYEAIFQYWYDAEGNIYGGATGKNTIKLEKNTILYAKWEYPDAKYGNLEITKTVVDKDSYTDPTQNQEFSFTFKTSVSGSYNYAIYDHSANVKARGTIANNGTFKIQDGWRIRIIDIPKDENYSITETAISYYTNVSGPVSGTINAGATTYATVTNEYQKYADYTVKHFLQNADKNGYTEQADSAKKLHGIIGTDTKATASTYSGYTPKTVTQKKIQADGKTVIEIYYDLIAEATIKWNAGDGKFADGTKEKQTVHEYGTNPTPPELPSKESTAEFTYTFDKWTPDIVEVTGDTTYTATYSKTRNKYNVTGTIDNNGTVSNSSQSVEYGNVNYTMVFTPALGYEISGVKVNGKVYATFNSNSYSFSQEITEHTKVEVTTSCVVYTISYELNGGELAAGVTNPETYTIETETFTLNNPTRAGYKFKGWATSKDDATGMETVTVEKGTTGDKTYYAVWEKSSVDLTITAENDDPEQSFIFTVRRSDGEAFEPIDVVLCSENDFCVTIKDLPVGEYTVTEKDEWSWREDTVSSQTADLRTESKTLSFNFDEVDDLHWLSGYSYKRKKGDS